MKIDLSKAFRRNAQRGHDAIFIGAIITICGGAALAAAGLLLGDRLCIDPHVARAMLGTGLGTVIVGGSFAAATAR